MRIFLLAALSVMVTAHAEYEVRYYNAKKTSQIEDDDRAPQKTTIGDKRVIIPSVKGVIIARDGDMPGNYVIKTTKGVQIYRIMQGISAKKRESLQNELDRMVIGKALTLEKIEEIKKKVTKFYQNNGRALVVVNIPEQDVSEGVVVVTV